MSRAIAYGISILLFAGAIGCTVAAIVLKDWMVFEVLGGTTNEGLWGRETCSVVGCVFQPISDIECRPDLCPERTEYYLTYARVAAGLLITASAFWLLALMFSVLKASLKGCKSVGIGCTRFIFYNFGLFGALCASISWGLYYNFVIKEYVNNNSNPGTAFWLALGGWIAGTVGWLFIFMYKCIAG